VAYAEFAAATSRICEGALAVNGTLQSEVTAAYLAVVSIVRDRSRLRAGLVSEYMSLPSWSLVSACDLHVQPIVLMFSICNVQSCTACIAHVHVMWAKVLKLKVNFESCIADRKATTCI